MAVIPGVPAPGLRAAVESIRHWPLRRWIAAIVGAAVAAVLIGAPTDLIRTPFFTRMTPILWWNYPVLVASAALSGLAVATYVRPAVSNRPRGGGITGAGLLSAFAVGCPVCNKLVVAALGVSGALNIWAPLQPVLAVSAMALLIWSLLHRLRGELRCVMPAEHDIRDRGSVAGPGWADGLAPVSTFVGTTLDEGEAGRRPPAVPTAQAVSGSPRADG